MRACKPVLCVLSLSAVLALAPAAARAATGIVSCATFAAGLRDSSQSSPFLTVLKDYSSTFTNPANGQTIRFLAVRPTNTGTGIYETLVFFNGTSQITPDWPVAMLATSTTALCDNNALVFSDYPGIGDTTQPAEADFTFDNIASNVFNLLVRLNDNHGFKIKSINPTGWSLGTEAALKFTALATRNSSFSGRGMSINKLFLLASKTGGDLHSEPVATPLSCSSVPAATSAPYYPATGNQAMCVTSILDRLYELSSTLQWTAAVSLKSSLVGSLFPYAASSSGTTQSPYGPGDPTTICAATVNTSTNKVTSLCNLEAGEPVTSCGGTATACAATQSLFETNRLHTPYFNNISYAQFAGQRRLNFMFGYGSCPTASSASWSSVNCVFNPNQESNALYDAALEVNGSPCTTIEVGTDVSSPVVTGCPGLVAGRIGGVHVFNGAEDMFIRHDYANALCNWLNASGTAPCTVTTYANAGHGVQYVQGSAIYSAIRSALPPPR